MAWNDKQEQQQNKFNYTWREIHSELYYTAHTVNKIRQLLLAWLGFGNVFQVNT